MRSLLRSVLLFAMGTIVSIKITGIVVARQRDEGNQVSDEFRRLVIMDGTTFTSRSGGLRRAEMCVLMGGAKLDLREAVLDPAGARISLENTLGGLAVIVRDDWAVTVKEVLVGGGEVNIDVPDPDDLPATAPKLSIDVLTRLGATRITTRDDGF